MRLVQFLKAAFIDGHHYGAGETALIADHHFGAHIVDVAQPEPEAPQPEAQPEPEATGD